jgi:hypothetical protein
VADQRHRRGGAATTTALKPALADESVAAARFPHSLHSFGAGDGKPLEVIRMKENM